MALHHVQQVAVTLLLLDVASSCLSGGWRSDARLNNGRRWNCLGGSYRDTTELDESIKLKLKLKLNLCHYTDWSNLDVVSGPSSGSHPYMQCFAQLYSHTRICVSCCGTGRPPGSSIRSY
eukprot:COSAG06_NODE_23179_length_700_cov_1.199667_2_plen_120_part_00